MFQIKHPKSIFTETLAKVHVCEREREREREREERERERSMAVEETIPYTKIY